MHLSRAEFEGLVASALADIPPDFREKLDNVEIVVEDTPNPDGYGGPKTPPGVLLLGLYRGVPLTQRSVWASKLFPDQITIFQRPIESICRTHEEIVAQIRRTVLHEIAHHFGIPDQRLRELGC